MVNVYLDTAILGHWVLYYFRPVWAKSPPPTKAQQSLDLLKEIQNRYYTCDFETTNFALSELSQVIRDNLIAIKMMRDAQSLAYFHSLKDDYELDLQEKADATAYLVETMNLLRAAKIEIKRMEIAFSSASALSFTAGIDTADALHIAWAMERKCKYFVTSDERVIKRLSTYPPIGEVHDFHAVKPPTLHQFPEIRNA